jgi:2-polyprenyl-3-methyl-5-hydroxy-6-metoxy-1,4-benzoquinol methylase
LAPGLQWKHLLLAMINLATRSYQKELLDGDSVPFNDIRQNMKELNTINTFLGGHGISIAGVKKIIRQFPVSKKISICEIGCGGGDNLLALNKWCTRQNIAASFTGIDIKPECIEFATQQCSGLDAAWITSDYSNISFSSTKPDIIFSSLFCHHFAEDELTTMLQWMKRHSAKGFFINDLHRHTLAYWSIKMLTSFFSSSYLVKNDAPLSVARGFTKKEWKQIFTGAGIQNFSVEWKWAFRHLIVYCNG